MLSKMTLNVFTLVFATSAPWACSGGTQADAVSDASDAEDTSVPLDTLDSAEFRDSTDTSAPMDTSDAVDTDTGDGFVYTAIDGAACPLDHDVTAYGCECPANKVNIGCCTYAKQGFYCSELASGIRWWLHFSDCGCSSQSECPIKIEGVCPGYPGP